MVHSYVLGLLGKLCDKSGDAPAGKTLLTDMLPKVLAHHTCNLLRTRHQKALEMGEAQDVPESFTPYRLLPLGVLSMDR